MRTAFLLVLFLLVLSGCISQQTFSTPLAEQVQSFTGHDVDGDGQDDLFVYRFYPVSPPSSGLVIERTLLVYREVALTYTNTTDLSDTEVVALFQSFDAFRKPLTSDVSSCSSRLGLIGVTCVDAYTCTRLCASTSPSCKAAVENYEAAIGESILRYVHRSLSLSESLGSSARTITSFLDSTVADRTYLGTQLEASINNLYALEASPLLRHASLSQCAPIATRGAELQTTLHNLGDFELETRQYHYTMLLHLSPAQQARTFSQSQLEVRERLPSGIAQPVSLSSPFSYSASENLSFTTLAFESISKPRSKPHLLMYSFSSLHPPSEIASQFTVPVLGIQVINLEFFSLIVVFFDFLVPAVPNPYMAFGLAVAIPFILFLLSYWMLILLFHILRARITQQKVATGILKALRRTPVRWKTDAVLALIFLASGMGVSLLFAPVLSSMPDVFDMAERTFTDPFAFVAFVGVFFGSILLYLSAENRVKVSLLENVYGKQIREEKDLFFQNVAQLKEKLIQLRKLVKELGKENIDVSAEYDVAASLSDERLKTLAAKYDESKHHELQDHLRNVSDALERLQERMHMADAHWKQWELMLTKLFENQSELHASQLLTIPASLRIWVLQKYVREANDPNLVLEGSTVRRKQLSPEHVLQRLFTDGLLHTAVVSKDGELAVAKTTEGSRAVSAALGLKLLTYIKTVLRRSGKGDYTSFAAIGSRYVLAVHREGRLESVLVMPREKFKDALAAWKEKVAFFV